MRRIYKYPLARTGRAQSVTMLPGEVVHVAMQHDVPTLWALVEDGEPVTRTFSIFATGEFVAPQWAYVGTVFDGPFVWHVCEATS